MIILQSDFMNWMEALNEVVVYTKKRYFKNKNPDLIGVFKKEVLNSTNLFSSAAVCASFSSEGSSVSIVLGKKRNAAAGGQESGISAIIFNLRAYGYPEKQIACKNCEFTRSARFLLPRNKLFIAINPSNTLKAIKQFRHTYPQS